MSFNTKHLHAQHTCGVAIIINTHMCVTNPTSGCKYMMILEGFFLLIWNLLITGIQVLRYLTPNSKLNKNFVKWLFDPMDSLKFSFMFVSEFQHFLKKPY